jgi:hypothetical protein
MAEAAEEEEEPTPTPSGRTDTRSTSRSRSVCRAERASVSLLLRERRLGVLDSGEATLVAKLLLLLLLTVWLLVTGNSALAIAGTEAEAEEAVELYVTRLGSLLMASFSVCGSRLSAATSALSTQILPFLYRHAVASSRIRGRGARERVRPSRLPTRRVIVCAE